MSALVAEGLISGWGLSQVDVDVIERAHAAHPVSAVQISLAWMLHKYLNVVPIPGSRNRERILENLGASENAAQLRRQEAPASARAIRDAALVVDIRPHIRPTWVSTAHGRSTHGCTQTASRWHTASQWLVPHSSD